MDRLERYRELKRAKSEQVDVADLKKKIDSLNQMDNESVMTAVGQAMLRFFSDNYAEDDKRKDEVIRSVTDQLGKVILNAAKVNKQNVSDATKTLVESVKKTEKAISEAIQNIPETDLSGLDSAVRNIKPTDLRGLQADVQAFTKAVSALNKPKKTKEINLKPVIEALNKPVNVKFDIEYDQWDYPTTIKATEL